MDRQIDFVANHEPEVGCQSTSGSALLGHFEMPDAAADSGLRQVLVTQDRIVIARTVGGTCMRIAVPVAAYQGVAIRLVETAEGEDVEVVLAHRDRDLDVILYAADHADDIIAEWQLWAQRLALPLYLEETDGSRRAAFPQLGALLVGKVRPRRRKAVLSGRRPRFLARRKSGSTTSRPEVLRDHREIIARN
jgi:hypothetical protein